MTQIKNKLFVFFFVLINFVSFSFAVYPDFSFTTSSFPSGTVDITGQASSGTQVELYANGNFAGRKDVVSQSKIILLNNSIVDVNVAVGSSVVFRNNDLLNSMTLNFSGNVVVLPIGGTYTYSAGYNAGDILYTHVETGANSIIHVNNEMVNFNFTNIEQTYLLDGTNKIGFIQKYPLSNLSNQKNFNFSVFYDKYPNDILILNSTNITKQREGKYLGRVSNPSDKLFYIRDNNGPISNFGSLHPITLNGSKFDVTLDLHEGNNSIRFITTQPSNTNIFTGETIVNTIVDTINPFVNIVDSYFVDKDGFAVDVNFNGQTQYLNGLNLVLNLTTDAKTIEAVLNNVSISGDINDKGEVYFDLGLKEGTNSLVIIAQDSAKNIYKEAHVIEVNTQGPRLIVKEMKPEEIFSNQRTAHFYFQKIDGKTTQPNVDVTVFSFVKDSASYQDAPPGSEVPQSCSDFKSSFIRDLGQLDRNKPQGPSLNLDETQTSVGIQSFMFNRVDTTSNANGEFDVILGLQEKDFTSSDYNSATQQKTSSDVVSSVKSENIICFVLKDEFGNINIEDFQVTLDAGNTQWRPGEITTIPNTVYAAEIEDSGDVRSGNGHIRFGMIARFQYIGPGDVNTLTRVKISEDRATTSRHNENYGKIKVIQNEMNYRYDKSTGEMLVYVPIEVLPLKRAPSDYPDNFDLGFQAIVTYTVDDVDIPIDTKNPIYFRTKINVERPLDHTKWLSPKMLDDTLNFLNKSIYYTQKATDYMGFASIGGVLACTGAKFWHAAEITTAMALTDKNERKKAIEKADRTFYQICDRVACTASPRDCGLDGADEKGYVDVPKNADYNSQTLGSDKFSKNLYFKQDGLRTGELNNVRFTGTCDFNGDGINGDGVLLSADASLYKDSIPITGGRTTIKEENKIRGECVAAEGTFKKGGKSINYEDFAILSPKKRAEYKPKLNKVNLQSAGNVCFNENPPKYDNLRCNFFNPSNPFKGKDPATSIFSSVQCACITDTYSHLKVALRVQEGIQKCLAQAKIGYVKGSYCERLLSQAVCDIATNVVLPELQQNMRPRQGAGEAGDTRGGGLDFLANMKKSESAFNSRYSGSILTKSGLSTDQIINKACVGAITGDWSVLSDNILSSIDQNEVEPVLGPPFPESRQMGYNPITGEMSIQYRFTHGVVSGGQLIRTKAELICDSSAPYGQYCPESQILVSSDTSGGGFKSKNLPPVRKGGAVQDTVLITEAPARFWYNKLRLTYEYTLKGKKQTVQKEFTILHKQETLLGNCHWSPGVFGSSLTDSSDIGGTQISSMGGISCDSLFGKESLISLFEIDKQKTKLVPQQTFYPGNNVYVDLSFNIRNNDKFNQDLMLAYIPECTSGSADSTPYYLPQSENEVGKSLPYVVPLSSSKIDIPSLSGNSLIELAYIPEVSLQGQETYMAISTNSAGVDLRNKYIRIRSTSGLLAQIVDPTRVELKEGRVSLGAKLIKQDLNVNEGNKAQSQYVLYPIQTNSVGSIKPNEDASIKSDKIRIYFRNKIDDLFVDIVEATKPGEYSTVISFDQGSAVDPLKTGSCKVKMRILPSSEASQLTVENFESYNTAKDTNSQGDIITNVKTKDIISLPFSIRKKPTHPERDNLGFFTLTSPKPGYSVQVNPQGDELKIPINYVYQSIFGVTGKNLNPKLKVSLTAGRFGALVPTSTDTINIKTGKRSISLYFKFEGKLKEYINSQDLSTVSSWIGGGTSAIEMTLEYEFIEDKSKGKGINSGGKKTIKLYLVPNSAVSNNPSNIESKKNSEGSKPGEVKIPTN